ncbi:MAG: hypothetical protein MRZ79_01225 [Bacteroidia bacterium]|nr:hypothetical protein [Bacteroidia bacterium]
MKMFLRIILGFLSILPLASLIAVVYYHFSGSTPPIGPEIIELSLWVDILIHLLFFFLMLRIEAIETGSKILWCFRFLLAGVVSLPIFWYFFILNKEEYAVPDE